ncbi:hypothetical protein [Sphingomonas sp.]|uniref:hypothetical protein n=1 Tax=Sphingomonas sp. TaxID=28214 RepID=UPI0035A849F8
MSKGFRHWCGKGCYPGLKPFLFGTVQAETELEAIRELDAAWAKINPHAPPSWTPLPGLLAFRDDAA